MRTHIGRSGALMIMAAIGIAGCSADTGPSSAPTQAEQTATTEPSGSAGPAFECPAHGGQCLGPIEAGTYTTVTFEPAITYSVPEGWTNGEDLPGNFLIQLANDRRYLGIYRDVAAPLGCEETFDPTVEPTVEGLTRWLAGIPA